MVLVVGMAAAPAAPAAAGLSVGKPCHSLLGSEHEALRMSIHSRASNRRAV